MFFFSSILLCFLNCTAALQYFPAFLDPGVFFQDPPNDSKTIPKWFQNYSKTNPKLSENYSKIIPKLSEAIPTCSPNVYRRRPAPQPHSRPSAHIHPSGGGRRSPRAARCCGAPERERGVWLFFGAVQHFLTPQAGFRRPGSGRGPRSGFSGSGGEMARRNRPSYSWVKNRRFCHPASKYRKIL